MALGRETPRDAAAERERTFVRAVSSESYSLTEERRATARRPARHQGEGPPWEGGPSHWNKNILTPDTEPFRTQALHMHMESEAPGGISHCHGHQNEALFYVLEGRGHDIHDGERYDWEAGDLMVVHNDSVHQPPARFLSAQNRMFKHMGYEDVEQLEPAPE